MFFSILPSLGKCVGFKPPQVHALQALLNDKGYHCGEDDTVWWQFGMDTYSSLLTYQVCTPDTSCVPIADAWADCEGMKVVSCAGL